MKNNKISEFRIKELEWDVAVLKSEKNRLQNQIDRLNDSIAHRKFNQRYNTDIENKLDALISHLDLFAVYHIPNRSYWSFEKKKEDRNATKETK